MDKNKVILIGGNHHNGLGLVRSFGRNGIKPYGIIVCEQKKPFVCRSKFWEKTWVVNSEKEGFDLILKKFKNEKLKPVIIPWSDGAMSFLDNHIDKLESKFLFPNLSMKKGGINSLMDKYNQTNFCKNIGIQMLQTEIIAIGNEKNMDILSKFPFPIILKPVSSIEGKKSDITVCKDVTEFEIQLDVLQKKKYARILVQPFLQDMKEYVVTGAVSPMKGKETFTVIYDYRKWLPNTGSSCYMNILNDEKLICQTKDLMEMLRVGGFTGPIDIELFIDKDLNCYLNEINWRSSGDNIVSELTGVDSAFLWYCDIIGENTEFEKRICRRKGNCVIESTYLRYLVYKHLDFKTWLKEWREVECYALWASYDKKPAIHQYWYLFKELIKRGKTGDALSQK